MTTGFPTVPTRTALPADVEALVGVMTSAFLDDPLWGPAFPDLSRRAEQAAAMWRVYVTSALRYPWTLVTPRVEAAAVWIPPGGVELTHEEESGLEPLLIRTAGAEAAAGIMEIYGLIDDARPEEPHFYLTLLGTHTEHRGRGLGMGLLAESLARIDALGAAAYLESCNPANDRRYAGVGFVARDRITMPSGHVVTTMWRPPKAGSA